MRPSILLALPLLIALSAHAEDSPGMAQMVDSPQLKSAFQKAQTGEVELMVDIAADGKISHPRVVNSSPPGVFDAAALDMAKNQHLKPATEDGAPQAVHDYHIVIKFAADSPAPPAVSSDQ
jgi:TonB family protein